MTCVIAHRDGWMVSDRRTTYPGGLIGPYEVSKIKRASNVLAATAGAGVLSDELGEALAGKNEWTAQRAIVHMMKAGEDRGHALLLTPQGMWEIGGMGGVVKVAADYWAIGSGYQFALGWLAAKASLRALTPEDALHAINFASTRVNDVGDGYQVERL